MRAPLLSWCVAAAISGWPIHFGTAAGVPLETSSVTVVYNHESGATAAGLLPRPGFGVLVRRGADTLLLDVGGEPGIMLENLARAGDDLPHVGAVVITHNHWDHVYGLPGAMSGLARGATVYVPASAAAAIHQQYPAAKVVAVSAELQIAPGIWTTGPLHGELRGEALEEQALVIEDPAGLHILTGCSHPGILPIVRRAMSMFPDTPVALVAGGFHLGSTDEAEIRRISAELAGLGVQRIGPSHCSGDAARRVFREQWGERFVSFDLGDTYRFGQLGAGARQADDQRPTSQRQSGMSDNRVLRFGRPSMTTIRMEEMTWQDIRAAIDAGHDTVVVGIGSTEQHGPHLPTMTDTRIGDDLAHRVARRLGNALQARTIPFGVSEHHLAFGGTVSVTPATLHAVLTDYVDSLARCGFHRIVLLPSHGGNFGTVQQIIDESRDTRAGVVVTGYADLLGFSGFLEQASARFGVAADACGAHAGENETSMMLALEPGLVRRDRFAAGYVGPLGQEQVEIIFAKGMTALTANGVLGDPSGSTAERGEAYLDALVDFLVEKVRAEPAPTPHT